MAHLPRGFLSTYNLGQNKVEQQTPISPPPPPQIKDEPTQKPKHTIFSSLIWGVGGGGGGTNLPSMFSKIVGHYQPRPQGLLPSAIL